MAANGPQLYGHADALYSQLDSVNSNIHRVTPAIVTKWQCPKKDCCVAKKNFHYSDTRLHSVRVRVITLISGVLTLNNTSDYRATIGLSGRYWSRVRVSLIAR